MAVASIENRPLHALFAGPAGLVRSRLPGATRLSDLTAHAVRVPMQDRGLNLNLPEPEPTPDQEDHLGC